MKVTGIGAPKLPIHEAVASPKAAGAAFGDKLAQAVNSVSDQQIAADGKLSELASGKNADLHGTMIALEEADITLRAMVAVRDKVVNAYQEIMNMAI